MIQIDALNITRDSSINAPHFHVINVTFLEVATKNGEVIPIWDNCAGIALGKMSGPVIGLSQAFQRSFISNAHRQQDLSNAKKNRGQRKAKVRAGKKGQEEQGTTPKRGQGKETKNTKASYKKMMVEERNGREKQRQEKKGRGNERAVRERDNTKARKIITCMNQGFIADWGLKENYLVLFICSR